MSARRRLWYRWNGRLRRRRGCSFCLIDNGAIEAVERRVDRRAAIPAEQCLGDDAVREVIAQPPDIERIPDRLAVWPLLPFGAACNTEVAHAPRPDDVRSFAGCRHLDRVGRSGRLRSLAGEFCRPSDLLFLLHVAPLSESFTALISDPRLKITYRPAIAAPGLPCVCAVRHLCGPRSRW